MDSTTTTIDQHFVEFVIKSLVGNPEAVQITRTIDDKGVLLELTVDPDDLGRVIGKRGATAQSLRTLLRALGTKNDARYNLKIIDNGTGASSSDDGSSSTDDSGFKRQDDDLDENQAQSVSDHDVKESDVIAKTRRELAEYDDLDV